MPSEFELLVNEMAAEAQTARTPQITKSFLRTIPAPAPPQRSAAQIDAERRQAFKTGAQEIMAKAMTAFHDGKIHGAAVNRLLARIHLAADRLFK